MIQGCVNRYTPIHRQTLTTKERSSNPPHRVHRKRICMNRLDALSRRGKGKRIAVGIARGVMTGACALGIIVSAYKLNLGGGITLAHETVESAVAAEGTELLRPLTPESSSSRLEVIKPLAENAPPSIAFRPSLRPPDGWTGNAVTLNGSGVVSLYGQVVSSHKGTVKASESAKAEGGRVEKSETKKDYFDDAVIIGNSLAVGLQKSGKLDTTYYANVGLTVDHFFKKNCIPTKNALGETSYITPAEALVTYDDFQKVYLMFGINELGWAKSYFISRYETVIDTILTIRPDAIIYVQEIFPINEDVYANSPERQDHITNYRIAEFNRAIAEMAERKGVFYLTPSEEICAERGKLDAVATSDGIHLLGSYITKWKDYLETHTVRVPTLSADTYLR